MHLRSRRRRLSFSVKPMEWATVWGPSSTDRCLTLLDHTSDMGKPTPHDLTQWDPPIKNPSMEWRRLVSSPHVEENRTEGPVSTPVEVCQVETSSGEVPEVLVNIHGE